jgi:hypothetical protein
MHTQSKNNLQRVKCAKRNVLFVILGAAGAIFKRYFAKMPARTGHLAYLPGGCDIWKTG